MTAALAPHNQPDPCSGGPAECLRTVSVSPCEQMLVCALLEDVAVLDNLDTILSVPGIDLYSIGPNDFAQSLGYPGQPGHPEVVKTMQEITRRIRQAGRTMQLDVMQGAWVSDMLLDAGHQILSSQHG